MSVSAEEMFACAAATAQSATNEANFRSAISRSYYAAFHAAYAWHADLPVPGSAGARQTGMHETLVQQLYAPGLKRNDPLYMKSVALGKLLNQGRVLRTEADYQINKEISREQMNSAVAASAAILSTSQGDLSQETA